TVLHIRSEQKVFCAGADLKEVRTRMDAADGPDRMYAYVASIQRLYARIEKLPQVTLAARLIRGAEIRDGAAAGDLGAVHWAVPCAALAPRPADVAPRIARLPAA